MMWSQRAGGWADKAVERLGKEAFGYFFNKWKVRNASYLILGTVGYKYTHVFIFFVYIYF